MFVIDNDVFAEKAKDIALKYKTLYILGCFGAPMNEQNKNRYTKNYEYNAAASRKNKILNASHDTFGFDCVCLIKGILWGWNGNVSANYGGAKYIFNGVPDVGSDQIMNYCNEISKEFDNIEIGELVHIPGHVGIYIGDGLVVECTPIWEDGVQITAISNIGNKKDYNCRKWVEHGKLKYVNYKPVNNNIFSTKTTKDIAYEVIDGKWGNGTVRKEKLTKAGYNYTEIQNMVNQILSNDSKDKYYPIPKYNGISIVDALKSINVNSSFENRKSIAKNNGFMNYKGTATENILLLNLLKQGKLLR